MAYSISSKEKLAFLGSVAELLSTSRTKLDSAMDDCRDVANITNMAATDKVYNGMAAIATGFGDLLNKTRDSFGAVAETLSKGAENIGPEFASRIKTLADDYAAIPACDAYGAIKESTGLDDNMTPELQATLQGAIESVILLRKNYILELADVAGKCQSDPDFKEVVMKVGKESEDFSNNVLVVEYNKISEQLHALGIFLDKRMEELREDSTKVSQAAMPSGQAGVLNI